MDNMSRLIAPKNRIPILDLDDPVAVNRAYAKVVKEYFPISVKKYQNMSAVAVLRGDMDIEGNPIKKENK